MFKILISSHAYVVALNQQKLEHLAREKIHLSLVVPSNWKATLRDISLEKTSDPDYRIHALSTFGKGKNDRFFYNPLELFTIFNKEKPDLVHIEEEPWSVACLQLALMAKLFGAKSVFFTWENIKRVHSPWYAAIESLVLKLVDGAIAGNREAKEILQQKGFNKPLIVLPQLGVDPETFSRKDTKKLEKELGVKGFVLGFIGRLDEQKGIGDLVEAVKKLDFDWTLVIGGNGPLKGWVEQQSEGDSRIKYVGTINHSDMPYYISLLDVYVLPSRTTPVWKEQFGHVLIEALASETLVVGSNSGAIPEVVEDAGLIFGEGWVEELANVLTRLYKDKKLQTDLKKKGLELVKEKYTHQKIAVQTTSFYEQLLDQNKR